MTERFDSVTTYAPSELHSYTGKFLLKSTGVLYGSLPELLGAVARRIVSGKDDIKYLDEVEVYLTKQTDARELVTVGDLIDAVLLKLKDNPDAEGLNHAEIKRAEIISKHRLVLESTLSKICVEVDKESPVKYAVDYSRRLVIVESDFD